MFSSDRPIVSVPAALPNPFSESQINAQTNTWLRESRANLTIPQAFPAPALIMEHPNSTRQNDVNGPHEHGGIDKTAPTGDPRDPEPIHNPDGSVTTHIGGVTTTRYPDGRVVETMATQNGNIRTETFANGRRTRWVVGEGGAYSAQYETNPDKSGSDIIRRPDGSVETATYAPGGECIYRSYKPANGMGWEDRPGPDGKLVRYPVVWS